ncbi:MAG TPA: hypothetical protein VN884_11780 [Candidatus Sulfotelmatobacter sp.]|nr:hypothetical protein [Candidatus Sulfotelmatobacter sp.]
MLDGHYSTGLKHVATTVNSSNAAALLRVTQQALRIGKVVKINVGHRGER